MTMNDDSTYSEAWKKDADPDEFWDLISLARKDFAAFGEKLKGMDRRALIRFAWMFEEHASVLGNEPYSKHTDSTFSEDSLDDLWEEVVGRGRGFYEGVIAHPEKMPAEIDYSDVSHQIRYEASNVFHERYGEEIPPFSYDY
jgi:hypothetical protein